MLLSLPLPLPLQLVGGEHLQEVRNSYLTKKKREESSHIFAIFFSRIKIGYSNMVPHVLDILTLALNAIPHFVLDISQKEFKTTLVLKRGVFVSKLKV